MTRRRLRENFWRGSLLTVGGDLCESRRRGRRVNRNRRVEMQSVETQYIQFCCVRACACPSAHASCFVPRGIHQINHFFSQLQHSALPGCFILCCFFFFYLRFLRVLGRQRRNCCSTATALLCFMLLVVNLKLAHILILHAPVFRSIFFFSSTSFLLQGQVRGA